MKLHSLVHLKQDQVIEYIPWNLGYQWNNVDHNLNISLNLLNIFLARSFCKLRYGICKEIVLQIYMYNKLHLSLSLSREELTSQEWPPASSVGWDGFLKLCPSPQKEMDVYCLKCKVQQTCQKSINSHSLCFIRSRGFFHFPPPSPPFSPLVLHPLQCSLQTWSKYTPLCSTAWSNHQTSF